MPLAGVGMCCCDEEAECQLCTESPTPVLLATLTGTGCDQTFELAYNQAQVDQFNEWGGDEVACVWSLYTGRGYELTGILDACPIPEKTTEVAGRDCLVYLMAAYGSGIFVDKLIWSFRLVSWPDCDDLYESLETAQFALTEADWSPGPCAELEKTLSRWVTDFCDTEGGTVEITVKEE